MAHRSYRLSISPEDVPEVRRVIDFDGRCTLADVHAQIAHYYQLDDSEHLYAFFTSGRYWDKDAAYFDPRTEGRRTDRALLFRLNLSPGKCLLYLLDFGMEQRFTVTVVAVREVEQALPEPVLIEAVGEASAAGAPLAEADPQADDGEPAGDPPQLAPLVALAEAFLDLDDQVDELDAESGDARDKAPIVRASGEAALSLLQAVAEDRKLFFRLDDWLLERSLSVRLLDLPLQLAHAAAHELGVTLARALVFVDRELAQGDLAIVLAKAGRREEALAQLAANLEQAEEATLVEAKAGETYRALGDLPAAEAYFRRSLAEATTSTTRLQALVRLASCLFDQGRDADANEIMKAARALDTRTEQKAQPPAVGRNEPCPCGSGKKYKKCHGLKARVASDYVPSDARKLPSLAAMLSSTCSCSIETK